MPPPGRDRRGNAFVHSVTSAQKADKTTAGLPRFSLISHRGKVPFRDISVLMRLRNRRRKAVFRRSRKLPATPGGALPESSPSSIFASALHHDDDAPLPTDESALDTQAFMAVGHERIDLDEPGALVDEPEMLGRSTPRSARIPHGSAEAGTTIGPDTTIEGTIRLEGNLRVLGSVSGRLEIGGALTVDRGGTVDANVDARSVRVLGHLQGDVLCHDRLDVVEGSRIGGKFTTPVLVVEEGAEVHGSFAMRADAADQPSLFKMKESSTR
ncbi:MAG: polymer-forming cytoskeletal protein [Dehalococcoidia bacterium]|nr:polymer-forming cytoskeletal protein [Dehalococcoidia bacterium]